MRTSALRRGRQSGFTLIEVLIASVLSALGFSDGDPVIQWYLPGGVLLISVAAAVLRPPKRKVRRPHGMEG